MLPVNLLIISRNLFAPLVLLLPSMRIGVANAFFISALCGVRARHWQQTHSIYDRIHATTAFNKPFLLSVDADDAHAISQRKKMHHRFGRKMVEVLKIPTLSRCFFSPDHRDSYLLLFCCCYPVRLHNYQGRKHTLNNATGHNWQQPCTYTRGIPTKCHE